MSIATQVKIRELVSRIERLEKRMEELDKRTEEPVKKKPGRPKKESVDASNRFINLHENRE